MHSVPLPQFHRSPALAPQAAVHQPCDRAHAPGVLPMLPIPLRHDLKAPHAPDRVLHDDPPLGEGAVVGHIRRWTWFAAWLAAWRRAQPLRMQRSHADIGQVTQAVDARWQPPPQPRHGQQGEVSGRSAYGGVTSTMRPVVSSTATCVLSVCCFFLPLSIRVRREANTWALHGLLKGVDNAARSGVSASGASSVRRCFLPGSGRRMVSRLAASSSGSTRPSTRPTVECVTPNRKPRTVCMGYRRNQMMVSKSWSRGLGAKGVQPPIAAGGSGDSSARVCAPNDGQQLVDQLFKRRDRQPGHLLEDTWMVA